MTSMSVTILLIIPLRARGVRRRPGQSRSFRFRLAAAVGQEDAGVAFEAGMMRVIGETAGLSLGDRICLSLAKTRQARSLTADKAWRVVAKELGVDVDLVR